MKNKFLLAALLGSLLLSASGAAEWSFPQDHGARINNVPDWGNKGFTLEVWAKPEITDGGYAVLMRGSFGYPKFFRDKDFDCYLVTAQNKNAGSRVYAPVEPGKYHYYVMTGDPAQQHIYYDGKLMRTNQGSGTAAAGSGSVRCQNFHKLAAGFHCHIHNYFFLSVKNQVISKSE